MQKGPAIACSSAMTKVPASGNVVLLVLDGFDGPGAVVVKLLDCTCLIDVTLCADCTQSARCLFFTSTGADAVATVDRLRNSFGKAD